MILDTWIIIKYIEELHPSEDPSIPLPYADAVIFGHKRKVRTIVKATHRFINLNIVYLYHRLFVTRMSGGCTYMMLFCGCIERNTSSLYAKYLSTLPRYFKYVYIPRIFCTHFKLAINVYIVVTSLLNELEASGIVHWLNYRHIGCLKHDESHFYRFNWQLNSKWDYYLFPYFICWW